MPIRELRIQFSTLGLSGMAKLARQNRSGQSLQAYETARPLVEGKRGIEIGGPSAIFTRPIPHNAPRSQCRVLRCSC